MSLGISTGCCGVGSGVGGGVGFSGTGVGGLFGVVGGGVGVMELPPSSRRRFQYFWSSLKREAVPRFSCCAADAEPEEIESAATANASKVNFMIKGRSRWFFVRVLLHLVLFLLSTVL